MDKVEETSFIASPGKGAGAGRGGGAQQANALRILCPTLEGIVKLFIVMVQKGHGQLIDFLLIGW